ncbi:MAG: outer membrane lipoprotein-sorting protein [Methanosarcinaceae archaeon]|nr:outer membrane lipoprotein-sorting protein [Methanosarcinaceae archaeon]MDD4498657.1 outer membrane lipoprotein-sorting protein [Methanosarcinaceae archaeon]
MKPLAVLLLLTVVILISNCEEKTSEEKNETETLEKQEYNPAHEEKPTAEEIVAKMRAKRASIEDCSYTANMKSSFLEQNEERYEILWKKPGLMKSTIRRPEKNTESVIVSDENYQWIYNSDSNTALKTELSEETDISDNEACPLFFGENLNRNNSKIFLIGTEKIEGKDAYLLEFTPEEEHEFYLLKTKIWIDKETWLPIRYELYDNRERMAVEIEIQDLKINSGLPDSEFEFELPEGARVKTLSPEDYKIDLEKLALDEAEQRAGFEVLTPAYLPEGYVFNHSTSFNSRDRAYLTVINSDLSSFAAMPHYRRVTLVYTGENGRIRISETRYEEEKSAYRLFEKEGENIRVNGREGVLHPVFGGNMKELEWNDGELEISIMAALEKAELLKVAESISAKE